MKDEVKFSVAIPAYKAKFLAECIDSVIDQTYKNFELIIVNDASPEDLDNIVKKYDDSRIQYYKNEEGFGAKHVVGNWNKCLEYATGDYIMCIGDDDKLLPICLEEYVKLITMMPDLDVYHGMTEIIDEKSEIITIQEPRPLWESVYSIIWWRWRGRQQYIGDWLFKTETLKKRNGFFNIDYAWGADDVSAVMGAIKGGVANTYQPVFQYRVSNLTISKNTDNVLDKINSHTTVFKIYSDVLEESPENPTDKVYLKLITSHFHKYYDRAIGNDISDDIVAHPVHLFKWFLYAIKNDVSFRALSYALFVSFKHQIAK